MTLRVLLVTQYFRPQPLANAEVVGGLAHGLAALGHRVDVLTPTVDAVSDGRVVVHRAMGWFASDRASVAGRAVEYLSFSVGALLASYRPQRPSVVLVPSPPPTLGLVGWAISRIRRAPLVYVVQDLYPEVALATGAVKPGAMLRALGKTMQFVYRHAAATVVIDPMLVRAIAAANPSATVVPIRNAIDLAPFEGAGRDVGFLDEIGVPHGVHVVMYAGNVGRSQDLDGVIAATRASGAHFVVHGGGAALETLKQAVAVNGDSHVHFSPYRSRAELGRVYGSADLHIVPLKADIAAASVPSKLLSIFAAGRPAVVTAEPGSAAAAVLEEAHGGWLVPPGDPDALAAMITSVLADPEGLAAAGERARSWAFANAGEDRCAREYAALLAQVANA